MKNVFYLALAASLIVSCSTSKNNNSKKAQAHSNSKALCSNGFEKTQVNFFIEDSEGGLSPLALKDANPENEKHVITFGETDNTVERWWHFCDLNHDGRKDLIVSESNSMGTSGESMTRALLQCEGDLFVSVFEVECQSLSILETKDSEWDALITTTSQGSLASENFKTEYHAYHFNGKQYNRISKTYESGGKAWFYCDQKILETEIQDHTILPNNLANFNSKLLKSENSDIHFKLKNGQTKVIFSVPYESITEGTQYASFVHFYESKNLVLYKLSGWELVNYLLIDLVDGKEITLPSIPEFSPNGKYFLAIQGDLDIPELNSEVTFYKVEPSFEQLSQKLMLNKRIFKKLNWTSDNRLEGNSFELNGANPEIIRETHLFLTEPLE